MLWLLVLGSVRLKCRPSAEARLPNSYAMNGEHIREISGGTPEFNRHEPRRIENS